MHCLQNQLILSALTLILLMFGFAIFYKYSLHGIIFYNTGLANSYKTFTNLSLIDDVATAEKVYFQTITIDSITCKKSLRIGRVGDGGWDICQLPDFQLKKSKCISYSFGVNYVWEFDDTIASEYGCIVRTFDPSMRNEPEQSQRASKVWFYKIGLGKEDIIWSNGWCIMKMSSLLKKFNEYGKIIDILKVDIEFSEWDSFEMMVKEGLFVNVKQLLFETHTEELQGGVTSLQSFKRLLKLWFNLHSLGFRQWKHHWNRFGNYRSKHTWSLRTCCFEHYLINTNFISNVI